MKPVLKHIGSQMPDLGWMAAIIAGNLISWVTDYMNLAVAVGSLVIIYYRLKLAKMRHDEEQEDREPNKRKD